MKKILLLIVLCIICTGCTSNPLGMFGAPTVNITVNMGSNEGGDPGAPQVNNSQNHADISVPVEDGGFGEGADVLNKPDKSDEADGDGGKESVEDSTPEAGEVIPAPPLPVEPEVDA